MKASVALLLGALGAVSAPGPAPAVEWPERPVRVIVPSPPGSSVDYAARLYAEHLAPRWKQPVVVENRPGADGAIAVQALAGSKDGHTLLLSFPGIVTVVPLLHERLAYDPDNDLEPVASVASDFLGVVVPAALPVRTLGELVAFVRSRQGELNWAASPGAPYLSFLEFEKRAGIRMVPVPYRSGPSALPDLVAGQVQLAVLPLAAALAQAASGKLRVLATTATERLPAAAQVPTAREAGYPELTIDAPLGLFAPKGFAADKRERVSGDVAAVAKLPEVAARLSSLAMMANAMSAADYARVLREQRAHWEKLAKAQGSTLHRD